MLIAAAMSPAARAAEVGAVAGTTSYSSYAGEKDNFVATLDGANWHFEGQPGGAPMLTAWVPCARDGLGINAWCPVGSPGLLNVQLNDNDDTAAVVADGRLVTLSGGPGNDTLSGANARLNASGGPGGDSLAGAGPNAGGQSLGDFLDNRLGDAALRTALEQAALALRREAAKTDRPNIESLLCDLDHVHKKSPGSVRSSAAGIFDGRLRVRTQRPALSLKSFLRRALL